MKEKALIGPMEPFNDLLFKHCFFNSFFPVVQWSGQSILPYIFNEHVIYQLHDGFPSIKYDPEKDWTKVAQEQGLCLYTRQFCSSLGEEVRKSLVKGHPVILCVDCYYIPNRKDTYLKQHWPHTLLIYGFDKSKSEFYIIEHENRDTLSYGQKIISFSALEDGYEGYLMHFLNNQSNIPTFYEIEVKPESGIQITESNLVQQWLLQREKRKEGIHEGLAMIHNFSRLGSKEWIKRKELDRKIQAMVHSLNMVVHAKKAEYYGVKKLNMAFGPLRKLEEVLTHWNHIRGVMAKYMFSGVYRASSFEDTFKRLDGIYRLEMEYDRELYQISKNSHFV